MLCDIERRYSNNQKEMNSIDFLAIFIFGIGIELSFSDMISTDEAANCNSSTGLIDVVHACICPFIHKSLRRFPNETL